MKKIFAVLSLMFCSQLGAYQLPNQTLYGYSCGKHCNTLSKVPLHSEWFIDSGDLKHQPLLSQKSYSYRATISARDLMKGFDIHTTARNAVIRISPLDTNQLPHIALAAAGHQWSMEEASTLYSREQAFADPEYGKNVHTIIQLKSQLGAGRFQLISHQQDLPETNRYLVSVYDKYSNAYLEVTTDKQEYQLGDIVTANITLKDIDHYPTEKIQASIVDPKGNKTALDLEKTAHNKYRGRTVLQSTDNPKGANWYVEASVKARLGDQIITRQGHSAFSYAIPSAKIASIEPSPSDPLILTANIKTAASSRYAVEGVLYSKNKEGKLTPISISQSADWLPKGHHSLPLKLKNHKDYVKQPENLYIGYLHLIDYGQLKTVYHWDKPIKLTELG